jgi:hypothetical protein
MLLKSGEIAVNLGAFFIPPNLSFQFMKIPAILLLANVGH